MRVLAVSHSCVTDVNQQQFVAMRRIPGVEIELIVPANWKDEYSAGASIAPTLLPGIDFTVHQWPVRNPGHVSLHFYRRIDFRRVRRFAPDILLSAQEPWSLSGFQAAWLASKLHVPFVFQTNQNIQKRYPPPFNWIERYSYRTASAALAYSEEARQVLITKGIEGPTMLVPYGTDLTLFSRTSSTEMRDGLGLAGCLVLGYMGRLVREKGLDTLIDALAIIQQEVPDAKIRCLIVGSGPDEGELRRRTAELDVKKQIVFTGAVPHNRAGDYLRCMDVFVLPSRTMPNWKEQFGRVIIEAMACAVPVVGSSSGQIPVLIEDTGGGLVFREGDSRDLTNKLLCLIRDAEFRSSLGSIGEQAVRQRYTYDAIATQLHEILAKQIALWRKRLTIDSGQPGERPP